MLNKILTILILLFNFIIRRKHFKLTFHAEVDEPIKRWYYDFPHWGFDKSYLEMVAGADTMLDYYAKGKNKVTLEIIISKKLKWKYSCDDTLDMFVGEDLTKAKTWWDKVSLGRGYTGTNVINGEVKTTTFWICPVTLFVLGRYPNFIYVRPTATIVDINNG